jgi:hypothetical protein
MNRVGAGDDQGEHGADRCRLDHRAKGLIIVNAESLGEAVKDIARLVPFQRAVGVELVLENSFIGDGIGANGVRDKITGVVGDQGSKLFFHGAAPIRIDEGTGDKVDAEVAERVSLSTGSWKHCFTCVVIE